MPEPDYIDYQTAKKLFYESLADECLGTIRFLAVDIGELKALSERHPEATEDLAPEIIHLNQLLIQKLKRDAIHGKATADELGRVRRGRPGGVVSGTASTPSGAQAELFEPEERYSDTR